MIDKTNAQGWTETDINKVTSVGHSIYESATLKESPLVRQKLICTVANFFQVRVDSGVLKEIYDFAKEEARKMKKMGEVPEELTIAKAISEHAPAKRDRENGSDDEVLR